MSQKRPRSIEIPFGDTSEARQKRSRNGYSCPDASTIAPSSHPQSNPLPVGKLYPTQSHIASTFETTGVPTRDLVFQPAQDVAMYSTPHYHYTPINNIGDARNAMMAPNYGHLTQTTVDYHLQNNLPNHPDVGAHINDCFPGSRVGDEAHILDWIDANHPPALVLCVIGKVGVGKSTFAKHLARRLRQDRRLAAEVFLGFALPDWTVEFVVRMIAGQLCKAFPELSQRVYDAFRLDAGPSASFEARIDTLILNPIRSLGLSRPVVIILDALDQWAPHPIFIKTLGPLALESHLIRFIVLGRPGVEEHFRNVSMQQYELQGVAKPIMVDYFNTQFRQIEWRYGLKPDLPTVEQLVDKGHGMFVWSSTLCTLLQDRLIYPNPHDVISAILHSNKGIGDSDTLASLYYNAIKLRFPKPEHREPLKVYLGAILVLQEPLPISAFASLVALDPVVVRKIQSDLTPLQAAQVQGDQQSVYPAAMTFHLSLLEYLQSPDTPHQVAFPIDLLTSHCQLSRACLEQLRCFPVSSSSSFLSPLQQYAVTHWPIHTARGTPQLTPYSNADWKATPHFGIITALTLSQWKWWANTYIQSILSGSSLEAIHEVDSDCPPEGLAGMVLSRVARHLGSPKDINAGPGKIALLEVVAKLRHHSSEAWLDLGKAFYVAAQSRASSELIDSAVTACRWACELKEDRGFQTSSWLGRCLLIRFQRLGNVADLDEAITHHRDALSMRLQGHPKRASSLNSLANALRSYYGLKGTTASLEEVIVYHREALSLRPRGHPKRALSLNNLANALQSHFELKGTAASLEEAIMHHREALSLRPQGHPYRSESLNNLANTLQPHFELKGTAASLEEAIMHHREALSLRPQGHPDRSSSLNNLASALESRFELVKSIGVLQEAILLQQEALLLSPSDHKYYSLFQRRLVVLEGRLNSLGTGSNIEASE